MMVGVDSGGDRTERYPCFNDPIMLVNVLSVPPHVSDGG